MASYAQIVETIVEKQESKYCLRCVMPAVAVILVLVIVFIVFHEFKSLLLMYQNYISFQQFEEGVSHNKPKNVTNRQIGSTASQSTTITGTTVKYLTTVFYQL